MISFDDGYVGENAPNGYWYRWRWEEVGMRQRDGDSVLSGIGIPGKGDRKGPSPATSSTPAPTDEVGMRTPPRLQMGRLA